MIKHDLKGKVKESAKHIALMAKEKNHKPCKKCQPFIDYTTFSLTRDTINA